jgi:hypothetical protein
MQPILLRGKSRTLHKKREEFGTQQFRINGCVIRQLIRCFVTNGAANIARAGGEV